MRAAMLVLAGGCATAEPLPIERADIARVLFLADCKPRGCVVFPGADDARQNRSSVVERQVYLDPFSHDDAVWAELVDCVKRVYAPFDLVVTTTDPGSAPHAELMIAGYPQALGLVTAGGAAPMLCPGELYDNAVGFVFASAVPPEALCWAAAQESGHLFGLDHALHPLDPMTWLTPPVMKPGFQDVDAHCGEQSVRTCSCQRARQNSYAQLLATLGAAQVFDEPRYNTK